MRYPDDSDGALSPFLAGLPPGAVVDVAPGRYEGPVSITRPLTLRGAGELTRIAGCTGRPISISVEGTEPVVLESLRLEHGSAEDGGGLLIASGQVELRNVHFHHCSAERHGGAFAIKAGRVRAFRVYTFDTRARRGGAVWVGHRGQFFLHDSQLTRSEALFGGAFAFEDQAVAELEGITIRGARAGSSAGGQALYARGTEHGHPALRLNRVLIEDGPYGQPIVVDPKYPAEVRLEGCNMPRAVQTIAGFVDGGANLWR